MTFVQRATASGQTTARTEIQERIRLNDVRRQTTNRAARILRKLGFKDARAEQSDHGRRDAQATFMGFSFIVGIFWEGNVGLLPPSRSGSKWELLRNDLADLPAKLRPWLEKMARENRTA